MDNEEANNEMKFSTDEAYKVRETFYAQYKHELDQLWHNSLFLWGFDSLLFTGYGALILAWLKEEEIANVCIANAVASILALLGLIVTIIWIALAKGFKFWHEWNEGRIKRLESDRRFFHMPREYAMGGTTNRIEGFDDSLWIPTMGRYSQGRLAIILPQLVWCVWFAVLIWHRFIPILVAFDLIPECAFDWSVLTDCNRYDAGFIVISSLVVTGFIGFVFWCALRYVKSYSQKSYMRNEDHGEEFCFEVMLRIDQAEAVLDENSIESVGKLCDYILDYYRNIEHDLFLALKDVLGFANFDDWVARSDYHRVIKEFMDDYMHGAIKRSASEAAWIDLYVNEIRNNYNDCRELLRSKYGV